MEQNNIAVTDARENFSEIINRVAYGKERISLTRQNKEMAYVVPVEDIEFLEAIEDKYDLKQIEAIIDEMDVSGTFSLENVKKELGL